VSADRLFFLSLLADRGIGGLDGACGGKLIGGILLKPLSLSFCSLAYSLDEGLAESFPSALELMPELGRDEWWGSLSLSFSADRLPEFKPGSFNSVSLGFM
jgi:hypothetical protein